MTDDLDAAVEEWHETNRFDAIVSALTGLPDRELTDARLGRLASAYNNLDRYLEALATLDRVTPAGRETSLWAYRRGYAYFYQGEFRTALALFERAQALGDDDATVFIRFCHQEMAELGSSDPSEHPAFIEAAEVVESAEAAESGGAAEAPVAPGEYVRILSSDRWLTVSFQNEHPRVMAVGKALEERHPQAYMNGYNWDAVIRRYLEVHAPNLLEGLDSDPESGSYAAHYAQSPENRARAEQVMSILVRLVEEKDLLSDFVQREVDAIEWD
ncbi:MAG: Imm51 family immunity protein [Myxococcota bacterium]